MFRGGRFAEAGRDLDVVGRDVRQENRLLLERRLPNESFAQMPDVVEVLSLLVRVARDQSQRAARSRSPAA